jgi:2'-5' RNA ligase
MSARLFIALELAGEQRRLLVQWAREAVGPDRGMRVVAADNVHLTLAFLGHRSPDEIGPLSDLVESFSGRPAPRLTTGGALWLSPRRPHVLTVEVHHDDVLDDLHADLWRALEDMGHERDHRRFRPHLTVARVKHGWEAPGGALPPTPDLGLDVLGVALVRSWLGDGPPRYEALSRGVFAAVS